MVIDESDFWNYWLQYNCLSLPQVWSERLLEINWAKLAEVWPGPSPEPLLDLRNYGGGGGGGGVPEPLPPPHHEIGEPPPHHSPKYICL